MFFKAKIHEVPKHRSAVHRRRELGNCHALKSLSLLYNNVNSFKRTAAINEVQRFLLQHPVNIVALVETHYKKGDLAVRIAGYAGFHIFRPQGLKKGGGISVYISESLTVQQLTPIELRKHEFLWSEILNVGVPVNIITVYFSVGGKQVNNDCNEGLWSELNRILNSVKSSGEGSLIIGHFNGHIRGKPAAHKV